MIQRFPIPGGVCRADPVRLSLAGMVAVLLAACGLDHPSQEVPRRHPTGVTLAARGRLRARPAVPPPASGPARRRGCPPRAWAAGAMGWSTSRRATGLVARYGWWCSCTAPGATLSRGSGCCSRSPRQPNSSCSRPTGGTWDVICGGYGPDVRFIDQALEHLFQTYAVEATHLAIGGFSDGASYVLSLGLTNGDLFTHILAFSPGFLAPDQLAGQPRIFIAHGTQDTVLPIEQCSRRIVPQLQRAGYAVTYHEFDGPHTVPANIARQAVGWFTGAPP